MAKQALQGVSLLESYIYIYAHTQSFFSLLKSPCRDIISASDIAPSNVARGWGGSCQAPFTALIQKCEYLQIARRQKGLAWKAVAQPHLPMALLAQRHRDWG